MTHDDVIFLFGTNKNELEHTIKALYGQGFNGYKYLNRFFDFEFSLPDIDKDIYLQNKYHEHFETLLQDTIKYSIDYFTLSIRDIERVYTLIDIFKSQRNNACTADYIFIDYVIVVYAICLKIDNRVSYKEFIAGNGKENFLLYCNGCIYIIKDVYMNSDVETINKKIKEMYSMFPNCTYDDIYRINRESQYLKNSMKIRTMLSI